VSGVARGILETLEKNYNFEKSNSIFWPMLAMGYSRVPSKMSAILI